MIFIDRRLIGRVLGALIGIALAGALVVTARPAAEIPSLPASAAFSVPLSGELDVDPVSPRPVLEASGLRPGGRRAADRFTVRNQTGMPLGVGYRAKASATGLDGLLRVRLSSGETTLADTTLQGLRAGSALPLELAPGAASAIRIEAWIPATVDSGYESRSAAVSLVPVLIRKPAR